MKFWTDGDVLARSSRAADGALLNLRGGLVGLASLLGHESDATVLTSLDTNRLYMESISLFGSRLSVVVRAYLVVGVTSILQPVSASSWKWSRCEPNDSGRDWRRHCTFLECLLRVFNGSRENWTPPAFRRLTRKAFWPPTIGQSAVFRPGDAMSRHRPVGCGHLPGFNARGQGEGTYG
jgi:hypothetical protein